MVLFHIACSSDDDCSPNYFCGSELPGDGTNYFENPSSSLPGEGMFLQEPAMILDGESIVSLSATQHPDLASDICIFAVVQQESGNDGYVVGKGVNDRLRDFGLYLRSSRKTIWLAYGANSQGEGFREILFFYNVSVADGNRHSIAAVVDSSANRAVLYIDGEVAGQHTPLPSLPTFRPGVSISVLTILCVLIYCSNLIKPIAIITITKCIWQNLISFSAMCKAVETLRQLQDILTYFTTLVLLRILCSLNTVQF